MMAKISEVLAPLSETFPALVTLLFSMKARVSLSTVLRAIAPAPLTEMPAVPATPAAREAATVYAVIVQRETSISPLDRSTK